MAMNEKQLEELDALSAAATPGPWGVGERERGEWEVVLPIPKPCSVPGVPLAAVRQYARRNGKPDSAFIAAARTAVPALVAEVRRQAAVIAQLKAEFGSITANARSAER